MCGGWGTQKLKRQGMYSPTLTFTCMSRGAENASRGQVPQPDMDRHIAESKTARCATRERHTGYGSRDEDSNSVVTRRSRKLRHIEHTVSAKHVSHMHTAAPWALRYSMHGAVTRASTRFSTWAPPPPPSLPQCPRPSQTRCFACIDRGGAIMQTSWLTRRQG